MSSSRLRHGVLKQILQQSGEKTRAGSRMDNEYFS